MDYVYAYFYFTIVVISFYRLVGKDGKDGREGELAGEKISKL